MNSELDIQSAKNKISDLDSEQLTMLASFALRNIASKTTQLAYRSIQQSAPLLHTYRTRHCLIIAVVDLLASCIIAQCDARILVTKTEECAVHKLYTLFHQGLLRLHYFVTPNLHMRQPASFHSREVARFSEILSATSNAGDAARWA